MASLSLAYRDLVHVPTKVAGKHKAKCKLLDVSHNKMEDLASLASFQGLETLVIDNNLLTSHVKLPYLPELHTLWLNHNRIQNLQTFLDEVVQKVPSVQNLSLIGNPAAPSIMTGATRTESSEYRLLVINRLPTLKTLDQMPVTDKERAKARRLVVLK
eukprot:m.26585 g.26585  ORF g.26585 m.26585 type:complete len:158 (+) comp8848_c0_seq1:187-660(+)